MIAPQEDVDWGDPKQHFAWALRNMPSYAGYGAVTHPGMLTTWSEHLVKVGAVHVDYLRTLADEDGNIHVSKLPKQQIKWQPPFRGPRSNYNNAARWVSSDTEPIQPMRLPDVRELTQQENEYMIQQYRDAGLIKDAVVGPALAGEELGDST